MRRWATPAYGSAPCAGAASSSAPGWFDDNRRAIDEAAALGAPALVLVCGGLSEAATTPGRTGTSTAPGPTSPTPSPMLVPHAEDAGVTLAIEPLHPMFASDRCVVSTLGQALDIAERHPVGSVGVVVDTYHVWWDDQVYEQIRRAGPRIASCQLADWVTPLPAGVLTGRALPGDRPRRPAPGCGRRWTRPATPVRSRWRSSTTTLWARPGDEVLRDTIAAYLCVAASR